MYLEHILHAYLTTLCGKGIHTITEILVDHLDFDTSVGRIMEVGCESDRSRCGKENIQYSYLVL